MHKLYITYNPHADDCLLLPDAKIESYVAGRIEVFNAKQGEFDMHLTFAQDLAILALRVMIAEGKIAANAVELSFEDEIVPITESGRINQWPTGMGDYDLDLLSRLL